MTIEKIDNRILATYMHDSFIFEITKSDTDDDYTELWIYEIGYGDKNFVVGCAWEADEWKEYIENLGYKLIADYIDLRSKQEEGLEIVFEREEEMRRG